MNGADADTTAFLFSGTSAFTPEYFLQFGAMGLLFAVLMGLYALYNSYLKQRPNWGPNQNAKDVGYNEQMARTIWDVNKTMAEVAVTNKQIFEQTKRQTEVIERLARILERHGVKTDT